MDLNDAHAPITASEVEGQLDTLAAHKEAADPRFRLIAAWLDDTRAHVVVRAGHQGRLKGRSFPLPSYAYEVSDWLVWLAEPDDLDRAPRQPALNIPWVGVEGGLDLDVPQNISAACLEAVREPWPPGHEDARHTQN